VRFSVKKILLCFSLLAVLALNLQAQDSLSWQIRFLDDTKTLPKGKANNQAEIKAAAFSYCQQLQRKGYFEADIDTIIVVDNQHIIYIEKGNLYKWARLDCSQVDKNVLAALNISEKRWQNQPFLAEELDKICENMLVYCENKGFPFAQVYFEQVRIDSGRVEISLCLRKNRFVRVKNIRIENSNAKDENKTVISSGYLQRYLGIKKGSFYQENKIKKVKNRLSSLPFLSIKNAPYLIFEGDEVEIVLDLVAKNASKFDFLIGLQPNNNPANPNAARRLFVTGNVNLDLQNAFGKGERIAASWQQLRPSSPQLKVKTTLPYLFGTTVGLDANFDLYRRDSSYIDIGGELGAQFLTEGGNYWKAYWKNISTNVLFYDTLGIKISRRLPNIVDSRLNNIGIEYFYQQLDNRFCPRKGIELKINSSAGRKTIRKNATISGLRDLQGEKMAYLYDSLNLNSFQAQAQATASFFIPLGKNFCVHLRGQAAYLYSSGLVFQQELFRMGGQQTFRGFDEESLLATNYALATVETRFLLGGNSFLFLFGEGGTVGNFSRVAQTQDYLYSFGGGLALDTKAGVFAVGYGLGTYTDQPLIVSNGKIYFGYLNRF